MAATYLFTVAAAVAFLPAGALLYLVLDRFAAPRVPKSLFDERKVLLTFAVGIPLGIALGLVFLAYASSLTAGDLGGSSLWALLFALVAALLRRVLVLTRTFGGVGGADPLLPVHTLAYGAVSGGTVGLALGLDLFGQAPSPSMGTFLVFVGVAVGMVVVEAWAGLRFGRAMRRRFTWLPPFPVLGGELLALLAVAPVFSGFSAYGAVTLPLLIVGAGWALLLEEPKALRSLHRSVEASAVPSPRPFGRGSLRRTGPSEAETKEAAPLPAPEPAADDPEAP